MKHLVKKTLILPILLLANSVWAVENNLTKEQVHTIAADKVLTLQMIMKALSDTCLAESGEFSSTWDARNSVTVDKAKKLIGRLFQAIEQKGGADKAKQFRKQMNDQHEKTASDIAQDVKSYPKDKKRIACKRYHKDVTTGEWDVKKKYNIYYKMLSKY